MSSAAIRGSDERGGGTVLSVALCLCLLTVAWAATVVVGWLGAARGAQNAADLAALAGAAARADGADACVAARRAVHENGAQLIECHVSGDRHSFAVHVIAAGQLHPRVEGFPGEVRKEATAGTG